MKKIKVALVLVGLLALLALANYAFNMDPTQLAARGVGKGAHDHEHEGEHAEEAPAIAIRPLGAEGAPVSIDVFYAGEDVCREKFWPIMSEMNATYGDNVRIDFSDLTDPEVSERARKTALRGAPGLTIDGEVIVNVPGGGSFGKVVFSGSPEDLSWNPDMLHKAIQAKLTALGIHFDPPAPQTPPQADAHAGHSH